GNPTLHRAPPPNEQVRKWRSVLTRFLDLEPAPCQLPVRRREGSCTSHSGCGSGDCARHRICLLRLIREEPWIGNVSLCVVRIDPRVSALPQRRFPGAYTQQSSEAGFCHGAPCRCSDYCVGRGEQGIVKSILRRTFLDCVDGRQIL